MKHKISIINFILGCLYSFSVTYAILAPTDLQATLPEVLIYTFISTVILGVLIHVKKIYLISALFICGATAGLILFLTDSKVSVITGKISGDISNMLNIVTGNEMGMPAYDNKIVMVLCCLMGLYAAVFICRYFKFVITGITGMVVFIAQWILKINNTPMFLLFIFTMSVIYFIRIPKSKFIRQEEFKIKKSYCIAVSVFSIIAVSVSYLIPAITSDHDKKSLYAVIKDRIENQAYQNSRPVMTYFDISQAGFSEKNTLGGDVEINKAPVFNISPSKYPVYLAGVHKDYYTGTAWLNTNSDQAFSLQKAIECMEARISPLSEMRDKNNPYNSDYPFFTVKIYPLFPQKVVFAPSGTYMVSAEKKIYVHLSGNITASASFQNGDTYSLFFRVPDYSAILFSGYYEGLLNTVLAEMDPDMYRKADISMLEALTGYAKGINVKYTSMPGRIPERVKILSNEITKNFKPNDRLGKINAIMNYLHSYEYTLKPGKVPKGKDFVDYFLFENKKGYCTYFASAMAVLCRMQGMPVRYAEGYAVEPGKTVVTNADAHAWVEIYFEGAGWLTFDPTPRFDTGYQGIGPGITNSPVTTATAVITNSPPVSETADQTAASNSSDPGPEVTDDTKQPHNGGLKGYVIFLMIPLLGAFAVLMICYFKSMKKRIKKSNQITGYYSKIMKLAKIDGNPVIHGETANHFGERLDHIYKYNGTGLKDISAIYSREVFGRPGDFLGETEKVKDFYQNMYKDIQKRQGRIKTAIIKILMK